MPAERSLPARPSLEQQRKRARELLNGFLRGDAVALDRARRQLPDKRRITLTDAHFVIAREYGFESWARLRDHIAAIGGAAPRQPLRERFRAAVLARDAAALRAFLENPEARTLIDAPVFPFGVPAIVQVTGWDDVAIVDALLAAGADPNRRSDWWAGPFHALHHARGAVAERLLAAGAVPDACAAANLDRIDVLRALLDADPDRVHERGGDGQTPLHFARSRAVIDLLLEHGADPDARDVDHRATAAEWMLGGSATSERYPLARYLVERGAAADLFMAAALGLADRVDALLAEDPTRIRLRTGAGAYGEKPPSSFHFYTWSIGQDRSPLQTAVQFAQSAAVARLARHVAADDEVLRAEVRNAAAAGDAATLRLLLERRSDALRLPYEGNHGPLHGAATGGHVECCRILLAHGADPNARDASDNATPMHYAAEAGHRAVVELLADAGCDVDGAGDGHNLGVIGWATCFSRTHRDVADALLARGARATIFAAIRLGMLDEIRKQLVDTPDVLAERMNDGDMDGRTPLHHAVEEGDAEIVRLLLTAGADPNATTRAGARPARYVRGGPHRAAILELLLRHGAEPDDLLTLLLLRRFADAERLIERRPALLHGDGGEGDAAQPTPLHLAVSRGDADAVRWLIDQGADLDAVRVVGNCGVTPLHVAATEDAREVAELLVEAGADRTVRDTRWHADALGWAGHFGAQRVHDYLAALG